MSSEELRNINKRCDVIFKDFLSKLKSTKIQHCY